MSGIQLGDQLSPVVNGERFDAYVEARADGRIHAYDKRSVTNTSGTWRDA